MEQGSRSQKWSRKPQTPTHLLPKPWGQNGGTYPPRGCVILHIRSRLIIFLVFLGRHPPLKGLISMQPCLPCGSASFCIVNILVATSDGFSFVANDQVSKRCSGVCKKSSNLSPRANLAGKESGWMLHQLCVHWVMMSLAFFITAGIMDWWRYYIPCWYHGLVKVCVSKREKKWECLKMRAHLLWLWNYHHCEP